MKHGTLLLEKCYTAVVVPCWLAYLPITDSRAGLHLARTALT